MLARISWGRRLGCRVFFGLAVIAAGAVVLGVAGAAEAAYLGGAFETSVEEDGAIRLHWNGIWERASLGVDAADNGTVLPPPPGMELAFTNISGVTPMIFNASEEGWGFRVVEVHDTWVRAVLVDANGVQGVRPIEGLETEKPVGWEFRFSGWSESVHYPLPDVRAYWHQEFASGHDMHFQIEPVTCVIGEICTWQAKASNDVTSWLRRGWDRGGDWEVPAAEGIPEPTITLSGAWSLDLHDARLDIPKGSYVYAFEAYSLELYSVGVTLPTATAWTLELPVLIVDASATDEDAKEGLWVEGCAAFRHWPLGHPFELALEIHSEAGGVVLEGAFGSAIAFEQEAATIVARLPSMPHGRIHGGFNVTDASGQKASCSLVLDGVDLVAVPDAAGRGSSISFVDGTAWSQYIQDRKWTWWVDGAEAATNPYGTIAASPGWHSVCLQTSGSVHGLWLEDVACTDAFVPDAAPVLDQDQDGIPDDADNCPGTANRDQADEDGDGVGDACGAIHDTAAATTTVARRAECGVPGPDTDYDGTPDPCDLDIDGDRIENVVDNCPLVPNPQQTDEDGNGVGDLCEAGPEPPRPGGMAVRVSGEHTGSMASTGDSLGLVGVVAGAVFATAVIVGLVLRAGSVRGRRR